MTRSNGWSIHSTCPTTTQPYQAGRCQQEFTYDPWGAINKGLVTSPGVAIIGLMGTGKSLAAKTTMARLIQNGRHVIVSSDVKGEWTAMAEAIGGQVIPIGPGSQYTINPLDEGTRPAHMREAQWRQLVISRRELMLKSLCVTLRPDVPLSTRERVCLTHVVIALADGQIEAPLTAVEQHLRQPPATWPPDLAEPARDPQGRAIPPHPRQ